MFSEISLHILDIVQNSIKAGADIIEIKITVHTDTKRLKVEINDNGCGMSKAQLEQCVNPFFTSRTTRKVGLGIPFLISAVLIDKLKGAFNVIKKNYKILK